VISKGKRFEEKLSGRRNRRIERNWTKISVQLLETQKVNKKATVNYGPEFEVEVTELKDDGGGKKLQLEVSKSFPRTLVLRSPQEGRDLRGPLKRSTALTDPTRRGCAKTPTTAFFSSAVV
jgi:hypothetical protein